MAITYLNGDATKPTLSKGETGLLVHICNDVGGFGKGFVLAVSKRWPAPEKAYREWFRAKTHPTWGSFELGNIQIIQVSPQLSVVNMLAQQGYGKHNTNLHRTVEADSKPPINYEALEKCLTKVALSARVNGASIHGPRFGCGLAGSNWGLVGPIVERTLDGIDVSIYDL
jgi:hypothetical protein